MKPHRPFWIVRNRITGATKKVCTPSGEDGLWEVVLSDGSFVEHEAGPRSASPKTLTKRFTKSPEVLDMDGETRDYKTAVAFVVLAERCVLMAPWSVHARIFAALKRRGESGRFRLSSYGVSTSPALTREDLTWFEENWTGVMGDLRRRTLAGRAWKDVPTDGQKVSVVSFWVPLSEISDEVISLVIRALKLRPPVLVEGMRSDLLLVH